MDVLAEAGQETVAQFQVTYGMGRAIFFEADVTNKDQMTGE